MKKYINMMSKMFSVMIYVILILLVAEGLMKFINPLVKIPHGYICRGLGSRDVLELRQTFLKDKYLFWELDSNIEGINSVGFRDREFTAEKSKGTIRIICMGDAITFGCPVKLNNTFPKVLKEVLSAHFPHRKFEVFNAGVPGYTSYQGLLWFKRKIVHYNPDMVIVYYGINDSSPADIPDRYVHTLPQWLEHTLNFVRYSELYNFFLRIYLSFKYPVGVEGSYTSRRVSPQDFRNNIREINKLARSKGIKAVFIKRPVWYNRKKKKVFTDKDYIAPPGVWQIDVYPAFKTKERKGDVLFRNDTFPNSFHLTGQGCRVLAQEVFEGLLKKGYISPILKK